MRKHKTTEEQKRAPFVACGADDCHNGLMRVKLGTGFVMRDCVCFKNYKAGRLAAPIPVPVDVTYWWQST